MCLGNRRENDLSSVITAVCEDYRHERFVDTNRLARDRA
jgi:hypothetical protein